MVFDNNTEIADICRENALRFLLLRQHGPVRATCYWIGTRLLSHCCVSSTLMLLVNVELYMFALNFIYFVGMIVIFKVINYRQMLWGKDVECNDNGV